jgi:O-succinylhomoserine sulfhydrylase
MESVVTTPERPWGLGEPPHRPAPDWELRPQTQAVRGGQIRSGFSETSEALYLTSGFVYDQAQTAVDSFTEEVDHFVYSRFGNPTVAMFEERLRILEGAEACFATATGMAAVFAALASQVKAGDRVVASRALFGSCFVIVSDILPRWGVETVFVDGTDNAAWEEALSIPTNIVFLETPSNPMQEIVDLRHVSALAHAAGACVVVDNVFATPLGQRPLELGADIVVYSATKHIDGQGRVLGGAILCTEKFLHETLIPFTRHTGPALSAFNAWVLLKGLETLPVRLKEQVRSAELVAAALEQHPLVKLVRYPTAASHPQRELALSQMSSGGTIVTFEVVGESGEEQQRNAFALVDALRVIDISNNLGDAKSLITHPSTTTHRRIPPADRLAMGMTEGVLRLSVGLEHPDDLIADLSFGLAQIKM